MNHLALRRSAVALSSTVLALTALSACGGESEKDSKDDTSQESQDQKSEESEESDEPTDEASEDEGADGEVTPPGTQLAIGEAGTIPWVFGEAEGVVAVTPTAIRESKPEDLKLLTFDDPAKAASMTLFYIDIDVEIVEQNEKSFAYAQLPLSQFMGISGNQRAAALSVTKGKFPPCENKPFDKDAKAGDVVTTCIPFGVPKGSKVDGMIYAKPGTDYQINGGKPLIWR